MITLAVDSSLAATSVALLEDENIRSEICIHTGRNHAEVLLPTIERVLASGEIEKDQVDLLAVTIGPGSFTGLRVGLSSVKGLALVLCKPVVGVCTLDALAMNIASSRRVTLCPMVDAGRGEVYVALYLPSGFDSYEKVQTECVVRPSEFIRSIQGEVLFLGSGAEAYRDLIGDILPGRSSVAPSRFNMVRAAMVGLAGRKKFQSGETSDIMTLIPDYHRSSYAAAPIGRSE